MMYARCPQCGGALSVEVATLARGQGQVECSLCNARFNALPLLREGPTGSAPRPARAAEDRPEQPGLFDPVPPPFGLPKRRNDRPRSDRAVIAMVALLALTLGLQVAWAAQQSRIEHAALHALWQRACHSLGCTPPPLRDLDAIALVSRDVRQHPLVEDALLITASLANRGRHAAALPVIEIVLSDLSENRIAMRRFRPEEYAPDPDLRRRGLAPGSLLPVAFEVTDPGRDAVAFSFGFL
jgi:predicted Zn finger-like uncharacterized protein